MSRCINEPVNFITRPEHRQTVSSMRAQSGPGVEDREVFDLRRDLAGVGENRADAAGCDLFDETGVFAGRAGEQTAVAARNKIAARAVDDVSRELRLGVETDHLTANWFDFWNGVFD